jgi:hypothetical protein
LDGLNDGDPGSSVSTFTWLISTSPKSWTLEYFIMITFLANIIAIQLQVTIAKQQHRAGLRCCGGRSVRTEDSYCCKITWGHYVQSSRTFLKVPTRYIRFKLVTAVRGAWHWTTWSGAAVAVHTDTRGVFCCYPKIFYGFLFYYGESTDSSTGKVLYLNLLPHSLLPHIFLSNLIYLSILSTFLSFSVPLSSLLQNSWSVHVKPTLSH